MEPLDRQVHWDERYRAAGPERVSWYEAEPRLSLDLVELVGADQDTSVIDVGGGGSMLTPALQSRGFTDLTVLDVSGEAIRAVRTRLADPEAVAWIHTEVSTWTPARRWDVWHDRAVFHFLTDPDQRRTYRRLLHDAVEPGGAVLIITFAEDGPTTCSGLRVERYRADRLLEEVGTGFVELAHGRAIHTTPAGAAQPLTWIAVRSGRA